MPAFLIHLDPLIECQRRIIREHTETIDHVARNRLWFVHISRFYECLPRAVYKFIDEQLIVRIMHMSVKHITFRFSLVIKAVLPIVTEDGIMAQYNLPLIVMHFRIRLDPAKARRVKFAVADHVIVVSFDEK